MPTLPDASQFQAIADALRSSGRFASVDTTDDGIRCRARDVESEADYTLSIEDLGLVVRFETPDRWLSESIEADLYHASDSLDELLEESLDELEWPVDTAPVGSFRHYRSEELRYVFEHDVPTDGDPVANGRTWILAYEATFHELGDVAGPSETDD